MSTYDMYTSPVATETWDIPATGAARFSWEYDSGRQQLLDLYQRGKDKQWDATKRIDWGSRSIRCGSWKPAKRSCRSTGRASGKS